MSKHKYLNLLLLSIMIGSLMLGGSIPAAAQGSKPPLPAQPVPPPTSAAPALDQLAPDVIQQAPPMQDGMGNSPKMQQMEAMEKAPPPPPGKTSEMRSTTQAEREAARANAAPQKTGTAKKYAGFNPATKTLSPLAAGAPKLATMAAPLGTPDYFAIPNWANSPLPVVGPGPVTGITVLTGGGGYQNPVVTITDTPPGTGSGATATATAVAGVITGITVTSGGSNYSDPVVTIDDPTTNFEAGATAFVSQFGTLSGGMRKFMDGLPPFCALGQNNLGQCLPIATPDTTTFPGSDYYEIGLVQYRQQMHSDLPGPCTTTGGVTTCTPNGQGTLVRGYVQLAASGVPLSTANLDGTTTPLNLFGITKPQYLGPVVLATKNRPVRVKFVNLLPAGAGGDLFIPTDSTYMGAGMGPQTVVAQINVTAAGSGYTSVPNVTIAAPPCTASAACVTATAIATMAAGQVTGIQVTNGGAGYTAGSHPAVTFSSGGGTGAAATAVVPVVDEPYLDNRATLHLHGGNTPWISDGTPHQWTVPVGETTSYQKGVSAASVPDMWYDGSGALIPNSATCTQGTTTCTTQGARNDPGLGRMTFYYTNQESGRLMFYHDHAYGITRLNVYAGEAAGYLLADPAQEAPLAAATVPGTIVTDPATGAITSADLAHLLPLVVQDKSYVPDNGAAGGQLAATDPTWSVAQYGGFGNFWFPHVYMPNQNPYDISGANPYGRWDYGEWFWPPLSGLPFPSVPCTSAAYVGQTVTCPGTPNPSGTPEGFMDTAVVNGTAYPSTTLAPSAYRVQMLMAGNDRAWNWGVYYAVDKNGVICKGGTTFDAASCTEMKMVPAVPHSKISNPPLCPTPMPQAGGGLITALLDAGGLPLNGTGLEANCWPTSWPTDGRDGGVPDPATAGPPIIQIGTEGGLLPNVAVIPSTPNGFEYNRRSITVLNVFSHGLLTGAAERADAVVDFSGVPAGSVLMLYNDGPAPVPAFDPRVDYYTGDLDQTATGGAPSTQPGYGPNTRTVMQIKVAGTTDNAFSLPTLTTALPNIFVATQDKIIVPESAYPAGNGQGPDTYVRIQDTSLTGWLGAQVGGLTLTSGGAGYTSVPNVALTGGGGSGATAMAFLAPTSVGTLTGSGGSGYTSPPTVSFSGGGGTGATGTATLAPTSVANVSITSGGNGYTSLPTVTFTGGGGTGATGTAIVTNRRVTGVTVTNPGTGYTSRPSVSFSGGGGSGAAGTAVLNPTSVASLTLGNKGSNYTSAPTVRLTGGGGSGATGTATLTPTPVASVQLTSGGTGYTGAPTVTIDPPQTAGSTATAVATAPTTPLLPKAIQELFTLDYGRMNATLGVEIPNTNFTVQTTIPYGYIDPPTELFKDGDTQFWKITHNGVDTHWIHFHLFTVQVINRVGWDGAIKAPDPNEMSWKDTVRMNPLEDIVVALRPMKQQKIAATDLDLSKLPNSVRPLDVTMPVGATSAIGYTNVDPSGQPATVVNAMNNYGWEYVWHCHILGHEENDMMRATSMAVAPAAPSAPVATRSGSGNNQRVGLTWTDNSVNETGFTVQRRVGTTGNWTTIGTTLRALNAGAEMTTGGAVTFTDSLLARGTTYYYRVIANNLVGYTQPYAAPAAGYPTLTNNSDASAASNSVTTN